MKRLFTLIAAMGCVVGMMMADTFSDGNYVKIGSTGMTDETGISGITPEIEPSMSSGKVTYDVTTHTLTLDNVTIVGNQTNAQIFVNTGYSVDYDVTIKLVGKNVIKSTGTRALWLQNLTAGKKYIFSGDQSASLYVEGYGAIVSRRDYTADNDDEASKEKYYHIVRVEGGCHVEAVGLGSASYAVSCYRLEVDGSDLHIYQANNKAMDAKKTPYTVTNATQIFNMSDDVAIAREVYPVKYDGNNFSSAQSIFSSEQNWFASGAASYDPTTRTLTLDGVKGSTAKEYAIEVDDQSGSEEPVIISLKGENTVTSTNTYGSALYIKTPAVITSGGNSENTIEFKSKYAGIEIEDGSLTIQDNAVVKATGETHFGIVGKEKDAKYPMLAINASKLTANGKNACVMGVDLKLTQAAFKEPTKYGMSNNNVVDLNTTNVAKDVDVIFESSIKYVSVKVKEGMGAVSIWKGGENVGTSIQLTEPTTLTFKAEAAEGWHFYVWTFGGGWPLVEAEFTSTDLYQDVELEAWFFKDLPSDVAWHVSGADKIGNIETDDWTVSTIAMEGTPSVTSAAVWQQYEASQKIVYVNEESSKAGLYVADYNTSSNTMGTPVTIRDAQNDYYPVTAIAYDLGMNAVCMAAYNTYASTTEIITNYMAGATSDPFGIKRVEVNISSVSSSNPVVGMAVDGSSIVYILAKGISDDKTWVYSNKLGENTWSPLMNTGIAYSNDFKKQALAIDVKSGKLLWLTDNGSSTSAVYLIDLETNEVACAGLLSNNYNGLFQWVGKRVSLTLGVAAGQSEMGKATLSNGGTLGYFYEGAQAQITATPEVGCKFVQWSDGNKDAVRTVDMGAENIELQAEFAWADGITPYPIWVGGKQFHTQRLEMSNANNAAITSGKVTYSPENNSLTIDGLAISVMADNAITIGEEAKASKLTINWKNTSSIKGTYLGTPMELIKAEVAMTGGTFTLDGVGVGIVLSKGSKLTFEGAQGTVKGLSYGIKSNDAADNDKVIVRGSTLTIDGGTYATYNVSSVDWKYVATTPSDAKFDKDNKIIVDENDIEQKKVIFAADPILRCTPVTEGTGSFTMKLKDGTGETFTNIGYFAKDAEVNISAKAATDFTFGYWLDDPNWGDWTKKNDWLKASREYKKETAGEEKLQAQFYAKMKATATWYCVHSAAFEQFKSSDFGGGSTKSTSDASGITAGDYNGSQYYIAEGGEIKRFSFSSVTKDKEQASYATATKVAEYTGTVTDMAYSFADSRFYLVMGDTKLYKLNGDKVEEMGEFIKVKDAIETKVTVTCIAIDGDGKKYVLSSDGKLYIVKKEDTKNKKITVEAVGDKEGNVEASVGTSPQSMAFDHQSGDLYWGAGDYMRLINTKTAKSYPAADLGLTGGSQGYVKALHRRDRKVTVSVEVAAECKDMGTVTAGPGEETEFSILQGKEVTITAKPAEGYAFKQWIIKDEEGADPITEATYTVAASETTYVAYFEVSVEGLEDIKSSDSGVEKVLHEGQLYIIKGEKVYNVTGNRVK